MEEIKFDFNEDIIMQIEMASYMEYNDKIASINEHMGELYGYSDLYNTEFAQISYEKKLAYEAIEQLLQKVKQLESELKEADRLTEKYFDKYMKLRKVNK